MDMETEFGMESTTDSPMFSDSLTSVPDSPRSVPGEPSVFGRETESTTESLMFSDSPTSVPDSPRSVPGEPSVEEGMELQHSDRQVTENPLTTEADTASFTSDSRKNSFTKEVVKTPSNSVFKNYFTPDVVATPFTRDLSKNPFARNSFLTGCPLPDEEFKRPLKPPPRRRKSSDTPTTSPNDSPSTNTTTTTTNTYLAPKYDTCLTIVGGRVVQANSVSSSRRQRHGDSLCNDKQSSLSSSSPNSLEIRERRRSSDEEYECSLAEKIRSISGGYTYGVSETANVQNFSSPESSSDSESHALSETDLTFQQKNSERDHWQCQTSEICSSFERIDFLHPMRPILKERASRREARRKKRVSPTPSIGFVPLGKLLKTQSPVSGQWPPSPSYRTKIGHRQRELVPGSSFPSGPLNEDYAYLKRASGIVHLDLNSERGREEEDHSDKGLQSDDRGQEKRTAEEAFGYDFQSPSKPLLAVADVNA